ncbi:Uncharacterised protein [Vibrio cholerae]|nr:Uncharacterised protein [Vibrio cholerae]CSI10674.1 Uncharacterised protein [Vibrio cholerae]CSI46240.1 Uncharacterised protein [Vibrio cholerae]
MVKLFFRRQKFGRKATGVRNALYFIFQTFEQLLITWVFHDRHDFWWIRIGWRF